MCRSKRDDAVVPVAGIYDADGLLLGALHSAQPHVEQPVAFAACLLDPPACPLAERLRAEGISDHMQAQDSALFHTWPDVVTIVRPLIEADGLCAADEVGGHRLVVRHAQQADGTCATFYRLRHLRAACGADPTRR